MLLMADTFSGCEALGLSESQSKKGLVGILGGGVYPLRYTRKSEELEIDCIKFSNSEKIFYSV
jgi:hypothetical protein